MNQQETAKILVSMAMAYPNYKPENKEATIVFWQSIFAGYEYAEVSRALHDYIVSNTSGFAPSPGQLMALMNRSDVYEYPSDMDAWIMVRRALDDGYYHAAERFAELPEVVQQAVGSPENLRNWSQTDLDSVETVVQSNFLRSYRTTVQRDQDYRRMPAEMRARVDAARQKTLPHHEKVTYLPLAQRERTPAPKDSPIWEAAKGYEPVCNS